MGARSANEVYIPMGTCPNYQTDGVEFDQKFVAVENATVSGVVIHYETAADTNATVWELHVNDAATSPLVSFTGSATQGANTGLFLGANLRYQLQIGDVYHLETDGSDAGGGPEVAYATLVLTK